VSHGKSTTVKELAMGSFKYAITSFILLLIAMFLRDSNLKLILLLWALGLILVALFVALHEGERWTL
jgi:hypothetical protein